MLIYSSKIKNSSVSFSENVAISIVSYFFAATKFLKSLTVLDLFVLVLCAFFVFVFFSACLRPQESASLFGMDRKEVVRRKEIRNEPKD